MRPFEPVPFDQVPEQPRVPHALDRASVIRVPVQSRAYGPVEFHLRKLGNGPPLLLVHGFMTSSYSWRYVIAPLAEHFTVYAPDLLGSGESSKPDASYAPDALADSISELMTALGIRGAPVIGNSLGGYLCMRLALRDPGAMSRLVNLHSPGMATLRNYALSAALAVTPGAAGIVRRLVWRDPRRWVHKNVHYFDETLKSRQEHTAYATPLSSPEGIRAFYRMLKETFSVGEMRAFERRLRSGGAFPIPLQIIYAKADPMVPASVGQRLHALLPDAAFVTLERGSHFAHVDAPDLFLAAAMPFLRR